MTLKIRKGNDVYFQSMVSSFWMNNKGHLTMTVNDEDYEFDCDSLTFWSVSDEWQNNENYKGLIPIKD